MTRRWCPLCRVPLHDDGRCRSCWEVETGRCASHGYPRKSCPPCMATHQDVEGPRQRRLRALLGIEVHPALDTTCSPGPQ